MKLTIKRNDGHLGKNKKMDGKNIQIASINVNGIDKNKIDKLKDLKLDIIMLQETHNGFNNELIQYTEGKLNVIVITSNYTQNDVTGGIAILIKVKKYIQWEKIEVNKKYEGRLMHIKVNKINVINIYFPSNKYNKKNFIENFEQYISEYSMEQTLIGGDFNWVGDNIDRIGGMNSHDIKFREQMIKILNNHKLTDLFREYNMIRVEYTYEYRNGGGGLAG